MKRPRKARDTSWQLLRDVRAWFDRVSDNDNEGGSPAGINYLNGDSDKYPGDAWVHADQLRRRLKAFGAHRTRT
jgi:hypothetical protein